MAGTTDGVIHSSIGIDRIAGAMIGIGDGIRHTIGVGDIRIIITIATITLTTVLTDRLCTINLRSIIDLLTQVRAA